MFIYVRNQIPFPSIPEGYFAVSRVETGWRFHQVDTRETISVRKMRPDPTTWMSPPDSTNVSVYNIL